MDDKDIIIAVLAKQRNELLDEITNWRVTCEKLTQQLPKPELVTNGDLGSK